MSSEQQPGAQCAQAVEPGASESPRARRKRARVTVFANWCKGCGLCVAFCPKSVFEEDQEGHPIVAHPERCTVCNWCVMHCPDFAISMRVEEGDRPRGNGAGQENDE